MAKNKSKHTAAAPTKTEVLEAKTDALQDEVLRLQEMVEQGGDKRSGSATFRSEQAAMPAGALPEFEHGGQAYRFRIGAFRIGGQRHTAAEALNDPELIEKIVTTYPGVIEKL